MVSPEKWWVSQHCSLLWLSWRQSSAVLSRTYFWLDQMILQDSGILWLDDSKYIFGVNIYCWLFTDWRLSPTILTSSSKPPGWVNTSLLGASRALTWRTGSTTPLRHFIRMAVPVLENNLAEHLKSGCLGTHPLNSKSLYRAQEKKRKLDFF